MAITAWQLEPKRVAFHRALSLHQTSLSAAVDHYRASFKSLSINRESVRSAFDKYSVRTVGPLRTMWSHLYSVRLSPSNRHSWPMEVQLIVTGHCLYGEPL